MSKYLKYFKISDFQSKFTQWLIYFYNIFYILLGCVLRRLTGWMQTIRFRYRTPNCLVFILTYAVKSQNIYFSRSV